MIIIMISAIIGNMYVYDIVSAQTIGVLTKYFQYNFEHTFVRR